ncbi:Holliday junction resolvase RuvX [Lacibacterium aquatile]|uniref:Putative pre-16S rRNA nuclease n=1 Tax=Lacibacterium aquatile TaxID=1168082 RepID=A0ABW5DYS3_9PROT
MPLVTLPDLKEIFAKRQRLMGLDIGTKTIGLAVSDGLGMGASPMETLMRTKLGKDCEKLGKLVKDRQVGALIYGLPRNMDGSEGGSVQRIKDTAAEIDIRLKLPFFYWDERLSTVAVTRTLLEEDMSRAKRAEVVDARAAAYILQGVLDRLRHI